MSLDRLKAMLRLTGLPVVGRYPNASVRRGEGRIAIVFSGPARERAIDVDMRHVGDQADHEETELRLLARLKALDYTVDWQPREQAQPAETSGA